MYRCCRERELKDGILKEFDNIIKVYRVIGCFIWNGILMVYEYR